MYMASFPCLLLLLLRLPDRHHCISVSGTKASSTMWEIFLPQHLVKMSLWQVLMHKSQSDLEINITEYQEIVENTGFYIYYNIFAFFHTSCTCRSVTVMLQIDKQMEKTENCRSTRFTASH